MPRLVLSLLFIIFALTACGGSSDDSSNDGNGQTETTALPSVVVIDYPRDSTVVYAENLYISGQIQGDAQQFSLELLDTEDHVITTTMVNAEGETWSIELPHGYSGDPTEITIRAMPVDASDDTQPYDIASVLLTDLSYRPEGIFGSLLVPANGTEVGGDTLPVSGRVSGVDEITVTLTGDNGDVLDRQTVMLVNPYLVDDVPWEAEITLGDYTGQAEIRAFALDESGGEVELGAVRVTVTRAAG